MMKIQFFSRQVVRFFLRISSFLLLLNCRFWVRQCFPSLVSRVFPPPSFLVWKWSEGCVCASSGRSALLWHKPLSSRRKKKCNHITKEPFFRQHNKKTLAFFHHSLSCEKKSCFAFFAKSAWFDTSTTSTVRKN